MANQLPIIIALQFHISYAYITIQPASMVVSKYINQQLTCSTDNIAMVPDWYINDVLTPAGTLGNAINYYYNQGVWTVSLELQPRSSSVNVKCGNGTTFSTQVTIVWVKDAPRFNCTLSVFGSIVSWSQCISPQDYIDRYNYSITNSQNGLYISNITSNTSLDLRDYVCGFTYSFSIYPINVVGEGQGAMVDYTPVCPTSSGYQGPSTMLMVRTSSTWSNDLRTSANLSPSVTTTQSQVQGTNLAYTYIIAVIVSLFIILVVSTVILALYFYHRKVSKAKVDPGVHLSDSPTTLSRVEISVSENKDESNESSSNSSSDN